MLTCDQVITDTDTGKKSLIGLFDGMNPPEVPFPSSPFVVYARLSDAEGIYTFKTEIVFLDTDGEKKLGLVTTNQVTAPDRLGFVDLVMRLPVIPLPKYGKYEFQLYANDVFIGRTTIAVKKPKEK